MDGIRGVDGLPLARYPDDFTLTCIEVSLSHLESVRRNLMDGFTEV